MPNNSLQLIPDDYIKVKNIHRSDHDPYKMANSRSKFDRFRDVEDTASEDEVDGGITSLAADDSKYPQKSVRLFASFLLMSFFS